MIESFEPGVTTRLGIDYDSLAGVNPRLVYCSITGYGADGAHAGRPAIDALVAARTGHQWEARGVVGGTIARLAGAEGMMPGLEAPPGCWVGAERDGPLFSGLPWPSLADVLPGALAINAALRAREITGRGQHVETSIMQGVLCSTLGGWQRVEKPDRRTSRPGSSIRAPRRASSAARTAAGPITGCPLPGFVLGVSGGDRLELAPGVESPRRAGTRISTGAEDMVLLHHYTPPMAEAVARFSSDEWVRIAAEIGVPVQQVRAPEEALVDPLLLADGCVAEITDPELGPVRQVGQVYRLSACPNQLGGPPPRPGQHTDEVLAEAAARPGVPAPAGDGSSPPPTGPTLAAPLDGIVVLDLGLAVAGPFGTQLLADLGATVIKVSALHDDFWMSNHIAMCCNRGKRSVAINLKDPEGLAILHELVAGADIVQHNMRYDAAERLGVDYESLRQINPALIYCHTRGFERGPESTATGQ